jgi:hypothetical protein
MWVGTIDYFSESLDNTKEYSLGTLVTSSLGSQSHPTHPTVQLYVG